MKSQAPEVLSLIKACEMVSESSTQFHRRGPNDLLGKQLDLILEGGVASPYQHSDLLAPRLPPLGPAHDRGLVSAT